MRRIGKQPAAAPEYQESFVLKVRQAEEFRDRFPRDPDPILIEAFKNRCQFFPKENVFTYVHSLFVYRLTFFPDHPDHIIGEHKVQR